ncbi:MAG: hypothetical protein JKX94_00395, partial [Sneathiella sp.]|nr:hypothetical protein [Sneathiella sp.]
MRQSSSLNLQYSGAIKLVPQNAAKMGIIGAEYEIAADIFKPLNPDCIVSGWSGFEEYETELDARSGELSGSFNSFVLLRQSFDKERLKDQLRIIENELNDTATLIVEFDNPFYFNRLQHLQSADPAIILRQLLDLKADIHSFSKKVAATFTGMGFHVDRVFKNLGDSAAFEEWQQT